MFVPAFIDHILFKQNEMLSGKRNCIFTCLTFYLHLTKHIHILDECFSFAMIKSNQRLFIEYVILLLLLSINSSISWSLCLKCYIFWVHQWISNSSIYIFVQMSNCSLWQTWQYIAIFCVILSLQKSIK